MTTTITIHGAHASPVSWNFVRPHLGPSIDLSYDVADGFDAIAHRLTAEVAAIDGPIGIVAHSLGGNIALHIAGQLGDRLKGVVSLCSPFGGSEYAPYIRLLFPSYHPQLMVDIEPHSRPIQRGRAIKFGCPWTQIVATEDGVISRRSAESRDADMRIVRVATTHSESLLNGEVLDVIRAARATWGEA